MKTINYELAKKLYDAGVEIESEYFWEFDPVTFDGLVTITNKKQSFLDYKYYPAPNCEEVIEFLPDGIEIFKATWNFTIEYHKDWEFISKPTLLEALEATLEYLYDNL